MACSLYGVSFCWFSGGTHVVPGVLDLGLRVLRGWDEPIDGVRLSRV